MTEAEYQAQQTALLERSLSDARSGEVEGAKFEYEPTIDELTDVDALEPGDENPLDRPDRYNPLNHAYPIRVNITNRGELELFVKFMPVQGKNLPTDLIEISPAFEVPVSVEDVLISDPELDIEQKVELEDQAQAEILKEEVTNDKGWYLIPMIVKAAWVTEGDKIGEALGANVSKEEAAKLVPPTDLLTAIRKYRDAVAQDGSAPAALLDLLMHFDAKDRQAYQSFPSNEGDWNGPGMDGLYDDERRAKNQAVITSGDAIDEEWDDEEEDDLDDEDDDDDWDDDDDDDWDDDDDDDWEDDDDDDWEDDEDEEDLDDDE